METAEAAPPQGVKDRSKHFKLPSGATLHMQRPRYDAAAHLKNVLLKAGSAQPMSAEEMKQTLETLKENPEQGGALLQRVLAVVASPEVDAAMFACLVGSSYQPKGSEARIKLDQALMDDEDYGDDARGDLYSAFLHVLREAVLPFLGNLLSAWREFRQKDGGAPASSATSPQSAS